MQTDGKVDIRLNFKISICLEIKSKDKEVLTDEGKETNHLKGFFEGRLPLE